MREWLDELGLAFRTLRKYRGTTGLALSMLAVAIGGCTAVFTFVDTALWRPLPYREPGRLVALFRHDLVPGEPRNPTSPADFRDWREQSETLVSMTAAHPWDPVLSGDGTARRLPGLMVSGRLFELLGTAALHGRVFDEADERREERVVVLSHRLWMHAFGGEPDVVGRSLLLDGESYRVIGVMPPRFFFPPFWATEAELWTPLRWTEAERANRRSQYLRVFARLAPGRSLDDARAETTLLGARLAREFPETNAHSTIHLEPLREPAVGSERKALGILLAAVGVVLLIACANVANLLLVRAAARPRELTIRLALGAPRSRLFRQVAMESLALALIAAVVGWALAALVVRNGSLFASANPFPIAPRLDFRAFGFTVVATLFTAFVFGLAPAVHATRHRFTTELREGLSRRDSPIRSALVVAEVGLSLALLVGAGVLMRSFLHLSRFDPGFRRERLLTADLSLTGTAHTDAARQIALFDRILERIRSLPSVEEAALVNHLPIGGDLWRTPFFVEGVAAASEPLPAAAYRVVSLGYFRALGIPLVAGRLFGREDRADSQPVVVVNRTLARSFFGGGSPVGKRIHWGGGGRGGHQALVVGVVGDARQWSVTDPVRPEILFPYTQNPASWFLQTTLVVASRGGADQGSLDSGIHSAMAELAPDVPLMAGRRIEDILSANLARPRFQFEWMGLFATVALALTIGGVYGVLSFGVRRRYREIGMRMALGASPGDVARMVLRSGLSLIALGVLCGTLLALLLAGLLQNLVHGVSATDPLTLAASVALVVATGAAASFLPARRASMLSPLEVLRED